MLVIVFVIGPRTLAFEVRPPLAFPASLAPLAPRHDLRYRHGCPRAYPAAPSRAAGAF